MSKLLENAVVSIQLGVEDFQANDPKRAISAVRNFYAGVLLLAKETLARSAPDADLSDLIGAKYKPVPDGLGGVDFVQDGATTIDFVTIGRRFKDFSLAIDQKALAELNRLRNDVEHLYTQTPDEAVREAIANAFPVVVQLFEHMELMPGDFLHKAWPVMLEAKALFERELMACRGSFSQVEWISTTIANSGLACTACGSKLVRQQVTENSEQRNMELICRACGVEPETDRAIAAALSLALGYEAYTRVKETGEDGPLYHCSECGNETYVDFEEMCAVCGHEYDDRHCYRCNNPIPLNEIIFSSHDGLCSYCSYAFAKLMNE